MNEPIYLDNAATTRVSEAVTEVMLPYFGTTFGNPSSAHGFGRAARAGMESARRTVADIFGIDPAGVVFTSGGTEGDNLAVLGGALAGQIEGKPLRVLRPDTEHKAVLAAGKEVVRLGGEVVTVETDGNGVVSADDLAEVLHHRPGLVSVMWVNNETGVTQDIVAIGECCKEFGVPFHTDAVQAIGKVPCTTRAEWTMLSMSGHKIGAPKGIGVLLLKDTSAVKPMTYGGGQQRGIRSGTENVASIVGLARAIEMAASEITAHQELMSGLRTRLETGITGSIEDVTINCIDAARAPHITNISFANTDSESMLMNLDLAGVACSSGSACESGAVEPSYVLKALGYDDERATSAIRFSFSHENTKVDVNHALDVLPDVVARVRKLRAALGR